MEIIRIDTIILSILYTKQAVDKVRGMTLNEMIEVEDLLKLSNLRIRTHKLCEAGYIQEGYKSANSKTYFITNSGIKVLICN